MQHSSGATASEAWAQDFSESRLRPLQEGLKPLGVTRAPASCQGRRDLAVQESAEPWANRSRHCMTALQAAFLAPLIDLGWIPLVTDWTQARRARPNIATTPAAGWRQCPSNG